MDLWSIGMAFLSGMACVLTITSIINEEAFDIFLFGGISLAMLAIPILRQL